MRAILAILSFSLLALVACTPDHVDPSVHGPYTSAKIASVAAQRVASETGGNYYIVTCCGSMSPLINDNDSVVVRAVPLSDALLGHVVAYRPKWYGGGVIVHRLVGKISNGYIGEGDARMAAGQPIKPETFEPITDETFIGEVVDIYQVRP